MKTYKQIKEAIIKSDLTPNELSNLIRQAEWKRKKDVCKSFKFGQKVSFSNKGQKYIGQVKRIMKKNVKVEVREVDGEILGYYPIWHCSPGSLKLETI